MVLECLGELVYLSLEEVLDVLGHLLSQDLLLHIWEVDLLVFLDDLLVLEIVGELLVVIRLHELDGLA